MDVGQGQLPVVDRVLGGRRLPVRHLERDVERFSGGLLEGGVDEAEVMIADPFFGKGVGAGQDHPIPPVFLERQGFDPHPVAVARDPRLDGRFCFFPDVFHGCQPSLVFFSDDPNRALGPEIEQRITNSHRPAGRPVGDTNSGFGPSEFIDRLKEVYCITDFSSNRKNTV